MTDPKGEPPRTPDAGPPARAADRADRGELDAARWRGSVGLATGDADVAGAATLHAGQISEGFLSFLGTPFLRRLYRRITRSSTSFLLVARQDGDLAGFVAGSTDVAGLYRSFLVHDGLPAAAGVIRRLLPAWRRVIETVRHGSAKGPGRGRGPELLAIAVEPGHLGRGVGRSLVASFLDQVVDRGYDAAFVVVGADNAPAVGLYERAGFQTVGQFELHPGTASRLMQWDRPERVGPH